MSVMTTYQPHFTSIAQDSIIASRETVRELNSFFNVYSHRGLLSEHRHALIEPAHFSFKT